MDPHLPPDHPPELESVDEAAPQGLRVSLGAAGSGGNSPYRMLYAGDLAGGEQGQVSGALGGGLCDVNADSFDALMAGAKPTLQLKLTDPSQKGNVMIEMSLRFGHLRDFDPANLARQIPATATLANLRELLVRRLYGKATESEFDSGLARLRDADASLSWTGDALTRTAAPQAPPPQVVDSILDQIDLGDAPAAEKPPAAPRSPLTAAVSAAAGEAAIPSDEAAALRRALTEADRRIGVWVNAVLHAPAVQALEAAWRSLSFLVSHIEFRRGIRLSVMHAPRAAMCERLIALVVNPVFDDAAPAPDLIVVDAQFGNSAPEIEVLDELTQHAASLPAMMLTGVSCGFFGVKFAWQMPTLPPLRTLFDQWQFAKWKTLRQQPYARFLGAFFGRCLLRAPHAPSEATAADSKLSFREECVGEKDLVWANAPVPAAVCVAQSVAGTGWPTRMAGYRSGRVDGFTTGQVGRNAEKSLGPVEAALTPDKADEFTAVGLNAIVSVKDQDAVFTWNGLSAARPQRMDHAGLLEVSLPYQLFATRISGLLLALRPHVAELPPEQVTPFVRTHVCDWLGVAEAESIELVKVHVGPAPDDATAPYLAVTVVPPSAILPEAIPVVMGYRIR